MRSTEIAVLVVMIEVFDGTQKFNFALIASAACILAMTRRGMDGRTMSIAKAVNLRTSFTFTSGLRREGVQKGRPCGSHAPAKRGGPNMSAPISHRSEDRGSKSVRDAMIKTALGSCIGTLLALGTSILE
jgi:hypothetical protein